MPQTLYAHSPNTMAEWQLLADHLENVALLTEEFADHFGARDLGFNAGLLHDLGKADPEWQTYLAAAHRGQARAGTGPDHKGAGAKFAHDYRQPEVATVIMAHHGGLTDRDKLRVDLLDRSSRPGAAMAQTIATGLITQFRKHPARPPGFANAFTGSPGDATKYDFEMMQRLLFSALVDADSLDTEQHSAGDGTPARGDTIPLAELGRRLAAFEAANPPSDPTTTVNRVRAAARDACVESAKQEPGMFRLTVPTGGGKTRAAIAFALQHANSHPMHGFRRIVVAVPFTTITQQTAKAYRKIFEDEYEDPFPVVLEHHSAAFDNYDDEDNGDCTSAAAWPRLAAENWDASVVVTTTVQLFESLFANKRSKTRKLHNLARSIIILDEAQSLPTAFLRPILDALRFLCEHAGCTVVLSTATQPSFDVIPEFAQLDAREIVPGNARHFEQLKRVTYDWRIDRRYDWPELADWIENENQALVIVNVKKHAIAVLDELTSRGVKGLVHLSTLLCGAHRADVLTEIRRRLRDDEPCILVATQVVEAGVDLDFPAVYRSLGPLPSIIQAAGRCNREGQLGFTGGRMTVFRPADDSLPSGDYTTATELALIELLDPGFTPDSPDAIRRVTRLLYNRGAHAVDARQIQQKRAQLQYATVARDFHLIQDDTVDVVVDYGPPEHRREVEQAFDQLRQGTARGRTLFRRIQPNVVSVYKHQLPKMGAFIERINDADGNLLIGRWLGRYDLLRGLVVDDVEHIV